MRYAAGYGAILAVLLCLSGCSPSADKAGSGAEIAWGSSWDAALAEAKKSNKLVMVDFYTPT